MTFILRLRVQPLCYLVMRDFTLTAMFVLVRTLQLTSATPVTVLIEHTPAARSQAVCANAPNIVAGRYTLALDSLYIHQRSFAPSL